jgi:hypothetical protein
MEIIKDTNLVLEGFRSFKVVQPEDIGSHHLRWLQGVPEPDIVSEVCLKFEREKPVDYGGDIVDKKLEPKHIKVVVEWMRQICDKFKMGWTTYFLAIYILYVFLSKRHIHKTKLQLLAIGSFLIASKIEEIYPPDVNDWIWILSTTSENTYQHGDILRMEGILLREMGWAFSIPTPWTFLEIFTHQMEKSCQTNFKEKATQVLANATRFVEYARWLPSDIALACLKNAAGRVVSEEEWKAFLTSLKVKWNYSPSENYVACGEWLKQLSV